MCSFMWVTHTHERTRTIRRLKKSRGAKLRNSLLMCESDDIITSPKARYLTYLCIALNK